MTLVRWRVALLALCSVALLLGACAGTARGPLENGAEPSTSAPRRSPLPSSETSEPLAPFSGEIVYEIRVFDTTGPERSLGGYQLHYFISGSHWKHTDGDGRLVAQYEPSSKHIHYFVPTRRSFPASQVDASYKFTHTTETR